MVVVPYTNIASIKLLCINDKYVLFATYFRKFVCIMYYGIDSSFEIQYLLSKNNKKFIYITLGKYFLHNILIN